jgi:DNA-binding beta-propeller fold protein YncE
MARLIGTVVVVAAACVACGKQPPSARGEVPTEAARRGASTPHEALLVLAKQDRTLAIVDPSTLAVVARVPVGDDPHEVVAAEDGRTAYVTSYGHGTFHTLSVVDLVAQEPLPPVDLGALLGPHGIVARRGNVWFTAEGARAVGAFDPKQRKVDRVLGTGQDRTHMIFVSDDGRRIVTTNVSSGTVSLFDKRESWEETIVPVGPGAEGFDVSPDGKEIWVATAQRGSLVVIDAGNKSVLRTIDARIVGANRVKFTPDGRRVLVSSLRGGGLVVFDAQSKTLEKRVPLCRGTAGIVVQPSGARAFVACPPDHEVAVVDLGVLEVTGHVAAGHEPDGMAWASRP